MDFKNMNIMELEKYFNNLNTKEQLNTMIKVLHDRYNENHIQFLEYFKTLDYDDRVSLFLTIVKNDQYYIEDDEKYIIWEDEYITTDDETDSDDDDYSYHNTKIYDINKQLVHFNQIRIKKQKFEMIEPYEDNNSLYGGPPLIKCVCKGFYLDGLYREHIEQNKHIEYLKKQKLEKSKKTHSKRKIKDTKNNTILDYY